MLIKLNRPIWWLFLLASSHLLLATLYAQPAIFLQGNHLEMAVSQGGYYHTSFAPPASFHPTGTGLGFVSDVRRADWVSPGTPAYCGDYINAGLAIEGFAIEANGLTHQVNAAGSATGDMIPGAITRVENGPGLYRYAVWEGVAAGGALNLRQTTLFFRNRQYVYTTVDICNAAPFQLTELYYSRNWDPDNDHGFGGSFSTFHQILGQPPADNHASIRSEGTLHGCYMETMTADTRGRVSYGGFFHGPPSSSWNGIFPYQTSGSRTADESNQISFNIGTLQPGDCTCVSFATAFLESERGAAIAQLPIACAEINNLLADPDGYNLMATLDPFNSVRQDRTEETTALLRPNPTSGFVKVASEGELLLFDYAGKKVFSAKVSAEDQLDLSELPSGMYIARMNGETVKLLKH